MSTLAQKIAEAAIARHNCEHGNVLNLEWEAIWKDRLTVIARERLPSGSGFDAGTKIDHDLCNERQLAFETSFHHMNDAGMYDGWTEHSVMVRPLFMGFEIKVSGRNRNGIKEYIAEMLHDCLTKEYDWPRGEA